MDVQKYAPEQADSPTADNVDPSPFSYSTEEDQPSYYDDADKLSASESSSSSEEEADFTTTAIRGHIPEGGRRCREGRRGRALIGAGRGRGRGSGTSGRGGRKKGKKAKKQGT